MIKRKEIFVEDAIVDKEGLEHPIIACGLGVKGYGVSVGISITNPCDTHNVKLGETIAMGRAEKNPIVIVRTSVKYPITDAVVAKVVNNTIADVKAYPDAFIGGFTKKYKTKKE